MSNSLPATPTPSLAHRLQPCVARRRPSSALVLLLAGLAAACTVHTTRPAPAEPAPAPAPAASPSARSVPAARVEKGRVLVPGNITFLEGSATLHLASNPAFANENALESLRAFLAETTRVTKLRIESHSDNTAEAAQSLALTGARALAVKQWLVSHGIAPERLLAVGFGQSRPLESNATPAGRAANQRVEFWFAGLDGKPYLGLDETGGGKVFE